MKFIIKFSLTLPHQDSFTSLHFLNFLLGVLPRTGGQVLKKLLLENGCNLPDDNDEKFIKVRKMKRRYFTDNLHLRRRHLIFFVEWHLIFFVGLIGRSVHPTLSAGRGVGGGGGGGG